MKLNALKTAVFGLALLMTTAAFSQIEISEYSASNMNQFADEFLKFEDFIEIHNTSDQTVDLEDWAISDKLDNPLKWQFPAGASIGPDEYMIVWCSGRDLFDGEVYHTSFKLTQTKENEFAVDPGGNIIESTALEITLLGHSRCKVDDQWMICHDPTPQEATEDGAERYTAYTEEPSISLGAGFYEGPQTATISWDEEDVQIRYSLDGNIPTLNDPIYNEGDVITIEETTVLKAKAFSLDPNKDHGKVAFASYFIDDEISLPVFSIAANQLQDLANGDGEIRPIGSIEYFDTEGRLIARSYGELNRHGQDSWVNPHRSLDWVSRDEMGYSRTVNAKLFTYSDRDDYQRFMVRASGDDNYPATQDYVHEGSCHIRDEYVQQLAYNGELKLDIRAVERVVVFLNGDYWGVYGLRERPADHDYTSEYYDQDKFNLHYLLTWGETWAEYGGDEAFADWEELRDFILTEDMSIDENYQHVRDKMQVLGLIDYMIINLVAVSSDWMNYNTGWWRGLNPEGDHKKWGYILWDNDATFDYYINYSGVPNTNPDASPCDLEDIAAFMDQFFGGFGGGPGGGGPNVEIVDAASCETIENQTSPYASDDLVFQAVVNDDGWCCEEEWDAVCEDLYSEFQELGLDDPTTCNSILNGSSPYEADDATFQATLSLFPDCCDNWTNICNTVYESIDEGGGNGGYDPSVTDNFDVGKHEKILFKLMRENQDFEQLYHSRWADLRNTTFNCDHMLSTLDSMLTTILPEMPRQINRWGGSMNEWQSNVEDLKDFVSQRCDLLGGEIMDCFELSGPYQLTLLTEPDNVGEIDLNTLDIENFPWTGEYYGNMDNLIEANVRADNYVFSHWISTAGNTIFPNDEADEAKIRLVANDTLIAVFTNDISSIENVDDVFGLSVFPSPTSGEINVSFQLNNNNDINIDIFNTLGQKVTRLFQGRAIAGLNEQTYDLKQFGLSPGSYYVQLSSGDKVASRKLTLIP